MTTHDVILRIETENGQPRKWDWNALVCSEDEDKITVMDWAEPDLVHEANMNIAPEIRYA